MTQLYKIMPTLDDAPTSQVATLTGTQAGVATDVTTRAAGADLIQIYDVSEQKAKTISLSELANALTVAGTQAQLDT